MPKGCKSIKIYVVLDIDGKYCRATPVRLKVVNLSLMPPVHAMYFATDEGGLDCNNVVIFSHITTKMKDGNSCVVWVVVTVELHFPKVSEITS